MDTSTFFPVKDRRPAFLELSNRYKGAMVKVTGEHFHPAHVKGNEGVEVDALGSAGRLIMGPVAEAGSDGGDLRVHALRNPRHSPRRISVRSRQLDLVAVGNAMFAGGLTVQGDIERQPVSLR